MAIDNEVRMLARMHGTSVDEVLRRLRSVERSTSLEFVPIERNEAFFLLDLLSNARVEVIVR